MIGGAPPGLTIMIVKRMAGIQLNVLKDMAVEDHGEPWKAYQAGAMCVVNNQIDKQLKRFGAEVSDE